MGTVAYGNSFCELAHACLLTPQDLAQDQEITPASHSDPPEMAILISFCGQLHILYTYPCIHIHRYICKHIQEHANMKSPLRAHAYCEHNATDT